MSTCRIAVTGKAKRLHLSNEEYNRLRDEILNDFVSSWAFLDQENTSLMDGLIRCQRKVNSRSEQSPVDTTLSQSNLPSHLAAPSQVASRSNLHSLHNDVRLVLGRQKESRAWNQALGQSNVSQPQPPDRVDVPYIRNSSSTRELLRCSLPPQELSQHLLNVFLDYQNSQFYVGKETDLQNALDQMYDSPGAVTLSWFCQMYLIFSVSVQLTDDADKAEGIVWYNTGKSCMDDALDENSEDNLWVVRAMLLVCFYHSATEWDTIWIYIGTTFQHTRSSRSSRLTTI